MKVGGKRSGRKTVSVCFFKFLLVCELILTCPRAGPPSDHPHPNMHRRHKMNHKGQTEERKEREDKRMWNKVRKVRYKKTYSVANGLAMIANYKWAVKLDS